MRALSMDQVLGLLVTTQAKGILLLLAVALTALVLRRSAAAARHWLWLSGMVGLLCLPVAGALVPRWSVGVPEWIRVAFDGELRRLEPVPVFTPQPADSRTQAVLEPSRATGFRSARSGSPPASPVEPTPRADALAARAFSPAALLLAVWGLGAGLLLSSLAASLIAVARLGRGSPTFASVRVTELTDHMRLQMGIARSVRVVRGEPGTMPMSWGLFRPTILLPEGAERWYNARLVAVLLHELAHVRRRDCFSQVVAEVALALHWVNPFAWLAARRLRVEREHACDDAVLAAGARPSEYAEELISLARGFQPARHTTVAAVAMARPVHLAARVRALLQERRPRSQSYARAAALAASTGVAVVVLGAAVPTRAPAPRSSQSRRAVPAVVRPVQRRPDAALDQRTIPRDLTALISLTPLDQELSCGMATSGWERSTSNSNEDTHRLTWSKPGCDVQVRLEGDIEFTSDFRDVARLERDALLRIEEDDDRVERRVDVTPGADGSPVYQYRLDGRDQPFDDGARAWYQGMLVQVFRRGGFMAEERVAALLRSGGTAAVLQELDALYSDYVFATYARELLEQAPVTPDQAADLVNRAVPRVESDYYMAEILGAVAARHLGSDQVLDAFIAGSTSIESDHYRTEVLSTALAQASLTPPRVAAVLRSATGISSDHYLAQLLESIASRYALESSLREVYLGAVQSIESDHYRTEVLSSLLSRNDLAVDELAVVLRAVDGVESDHYRATVLQQIAERALPSDPLRSAYLEAASGIVSDHYRTEALAELVEQPLSATQLQELIRAAAGIESDHYKAGLLTDIVRRHRMEGPTREVFMQALDSVQSEHYRGQVAEALLRSDRGGL